MGMSGLIASFGANSASGIPYVVGVDHGCVAEVKAVNAKTDNDFMRRAEPSCLHAQIVQLLPRRDTLIHAHQRPAIFTDAQPSATAEQVAQPTTKLRKCKLWIRRACTTNTSKCRIVELGSSLLTPPRAHPHARGIRPPWSGAENVWQQYGHCVMYLADHRVKASLKI